MSSNNKLFLELIIVLVLVGFGLWTLNKNNGKILPDQQITPTEDVSQGSVNSSGSSTAISYTEALAKYKDARIQLDKICQASPKSGTFKNGTNLMIDNRSDKSRTVKVGTSFTVKPWGFKIVKLSSATLPATWYVDCDSSQNVATILIQK